MKLLHIVALVVCAAVPVTAQYSDVVPDVTWAMVTVDAATRAALQVPDAPPAATPPQCFECFFGNGFTAVTKSEHEYLGFHGDMNLLHVVSTLLSHPTLALTHFFETGTHRGSSLHWVLRSFPDLDAYFTAEVDEVLLHDMLRFLSSIREPVVNPAWAVGATPPPGAHVRRGSVTLALMPDASQQLLRRLPAAFPAVKQVSTMFWLDAHPSGEQWERFGANFTLSLQTEVAQITHTWTSGVILVDDAVAPTQPHFGYDNPLYNVERLTAAMDPAAAVSWYFPAYPASTSTYHPPRGWILFFFTHPAHPGAPALLPMLRDLGGIAAFGGSTLGASHPDAHLQHAALMQPLLASSAVFASAQASLSARALAARLPASPASRVAPEAAAQWHRLVDELQQPAAAQCSTGALRMLVLPSMASLETAMWPGANDGVHPEDRVARMAFLLGAWHAVATITGRTLVEAQRTSSPWDLAPTAHCGAAGTQWGCFFHPLSTCSVGAPAGGSLAGVPQLDAAAVLAQFKDRQPGAWDGTPLRDAGPNVVVAPAVGRVHALLEAATRMVPAWFRRHATNDAEAVHLWTALFVQRVTRPDAVLQALTLAGRPHPAAHYESLLRNAPRAPLPSRALSVAVHTPGGSAQAAGQHLGWALRQAKAVHTAVHATHAPLYLAAAGLSALGVSATHNVYAAAQPQFSVLSLGAVVDVQSGDVASPPAVSPRAAYLMAARAVHDMVGARAQMVIGDCRSPYSALLATKALAGGSLVMPPVSASAVGCVAHQQQQYGWTPVPQWHVGVAA